MEKSNTEHLRDLISKTLASNSENFEEINEFIDAIESNETDFENQIKSLKLEVRENESEISNLEDAINEPESFETIDCGIGKIEWRADNLKLQMLMENFAEKQSAGIYQ